MPKSSKRFILSTSGLNAQGFRMMTEGAILSDFEKNPLMLFNHQRPDGVDKNQILPIGHWEDIEINGDEISAVPVFDDKDDFAMSIYHKVEGNHLRMCSAGAEPVETSSNPKFLLPGQTKATVIKWKLKEASIVDIGANPDSLTVALYDNQDNLIKLSDSTIETIIPNIHKMAETKITAKDAAEKAAIAKKEAADAAEKAIKLADEAKKAELNDDTEMESLSEEEPDGDECDPNDKDAVIESLKKKLADCQEQLRLSQEKLSLADANKAEQDATQLADKAFALRKITAAQKPHIIKLALNDYNGTVEYLNTIKPSQSIKEQIELADKKKTVEATKIETLSTKSWDELFKETGAIDYIRLNAPEVYKAKYKSKFGKDPKNA